MNFSAINIQGNIISLEILDKIRNDENYPHQKARDFGFETGISVREKIGNAWSEAKILWELYLKKMEKLPEGDYGTTETRKLWIIPLLYEFGYDIESSPSVEINGKPFPISHRDVNRKDFPVLIMGYHDRLDRKPEGSRLRMSPHALMQEYLNHTDNLYGLVINGGQIRLLRDSNRLTKLAYLEFDIGKMMEEDLFYEFALMYRVIHASRMPASQDEVEKTIFEYYHQESIESGARIREKLRSAVKESMELIAKGFLSHPENEAFIEKVRSGEIKAERFYKILLRTIYRIIFLATIEERNLVYEKFTKDDPDYEKKNRLRNIYLDFYSFERLRNLALSPVYIDPRKQDLWQSLLATFRLFEPLGEGEKLGIKPLGGDLFGDNSLRLDGIDFYELKLHNKFMLEILERLTTFRDERKQLTRVNYRDLDVEELGSVYEALLELQPYFNTEIATPAFSFSEGSLRKLTGSYYTRHDLVAHLIKTALIPMMEDRLKTAKTKEEKINSILNISVCDPAAGSGHFLLAASRVLGYELAKIRTNEENPGEEPVLEATRDVIDNCIYGVDKNPAAVELCRLSLWLVAHNSGKPLTFLEHKIKCGDSLVGVDSLKHLIGGIPEGAFSPLSGDDREVASELKKLNRDFLKKKQLSLFSQAEKLEAHQQQFAGKYRQLLGLKVYTHEDYENKRREYSRIVRDPQMLKDQTACNLFTYAFFQEYIADKPQRLYVHSEFLASFMGSAGSLNAQLESQATTAATNHRFFHWPLEFPYIAAKGGFDVMLGNPPWEIVELKEKEFFETRNTEIAEAANKAERIRLIEELAMTNPELYAEYLTELRTFNASRKFMQDSGILTLTNSGRLNLYAAFAEKILNSINKNGSAGFIVPTGIATDDGNKRYFAYLIENGQLVSLFDFENRKKIFPSVDSRYKFSLVTIGNIQNNRQTRFGFFLHDVLDLTDKRRVFALTRQDFLNINPNTKTTPIFRTHQDAELTAKIYSLVPVLINEEKKRNPWGVTFKQGLFNMSTDSRLFRTRAQMESDGFMLKGNRFVKGAETWLPLYESKMIWHYDHRFGSYKGVDSRTSTHTPTPSLKQYQDANYMIQPWYWVNEWNVIEQITPFPKAMVLAYKEKNTKLLCQYLTVVLFASFLHKKVQPAEVLSNRLWELYQEFVQKHPLFNSIPPTILGLIADEAQGHYKRIFPNMLPALSIVEIHNLDCRNAPAWYVVDNDRLNTFLKFWEFTSMFSFDQERFMDQTDIINATYLLLKQSIGKWFLGFRDITNNTNERTGIFSIIPCHGVGNNLPLLFLEKTAPSILLLEANINSLNVDYITRQKIAGTHMNFFYLEQFAILPYEAYLTNVCKQIIADALELNYSSYDIKAFPDEVWKEANIELRKTIVHQWQENKASTGGHAWSVPEWKDAYPEIHWRSPMEQPGWTEEDLLNYEEGCPLPPFKWDEDRRARLKAELDAYYALLYGLNRDELRYILDPQDVYGPDFPGETFRVLKEKELRKYGEYRTRRLVLEAYDRLSPSWDMEAHLKRLKEVWEKYQVDLSGGKQKKYKASKKVSTAEEKESGYRQRGMFDEST